MDEKTTYPNSRTSNLVLLDSPMRETSFEITQRTLKSLKASGLTQSEQLLLSVLKQSICSEREPAVSDVIVFWTDADGQRHSAGVGKAKEVSK